MRDYKEIQVIITIITKNEDLINTGDSLIAATAWNQYVDEYKSSNQLLDEIRKAIIEKEI